MYTHTKRMDIPYDFDSQNMDIASVFWDFYLAEESEDEDILVRPKARKERGPWSTEEDAGLLQMGPQNYVTHRSKRACRMRYAVLVPKPKKIPWTKKEDAELMRIGYKAYSSKGVRTLDSCRYRLDKLLKN